MTSVISCPWVGSCVVGQQLPGEPPRHQSASEIRDRGGGAWGRSLRVQTQGRWDGGSLLLHRGGRGVAVSQRKTASGRESTQPKVA